MTTFSNLLKTPAEKVILDALAKNKALRTTNIKEDLLELGYMFSYEDYRIYGDDETTYMFFNPSAFSGKSLIILPPFFASVAGPVLVDYYANPTMADAGAVLQVSNRKGTSSNTPDSILTLHTIAPTIEGFRFTGRLVPATGVNPNIGSSAEGLGQNYFELVPSNTYLIKITNKNGPGVYIQSDFTWIEIPEGYPVAIEVP